LRRVPTTTDYQASDLSSGFSKSNAHSPSINDNRMTTCTAVFDIGKTNKKLVLFDDSFHIVQEFGEVFPETTDEDGFPCDDLPKLSEWMRQMWRELEQNPAYKVRALNFTTYGASLVHLNDRDEPVTPLYAYLKPFPEDLAERFYGQYGEPLALATQTASPPLGMLNSGLQLYWLKHRKPDIFRQIRTSLHFPQYCAFLFTGQKASEYTSIGCHTALWDFQKQDYHAWVHEEGLLPLLPPIHTQPLLGHTRFRNSLIPVGTGLHDSSAALIPYLKRNADPFLLLSTGTWCITLNPFARQPLTSEELQQDCLQFFTYDGAIVKAARLFTGNEHNHWVSQLAEYYEKAPNYYQTVRFNAQLLRMTEPFISSPAPMGTLTYGDAINEVRLDLAAYDTYEAAYHTLVADMVARQTASVRLAGEGLRGHRRLYVDGGFCRNDVFMQMLNRLLPDLEVVASEENQGTALGAAMLMQRIE
jgi:L-fuculokinase